VYRLYEAITHGGESLKAIINEEFGDGIMSAIGFYATVDKVGRRWLKALGGTQARWPACSAAHTLCMMCQCAGRPSVAAERGRPGAVRSVGVLSQATFPTPPSLFCKQVQGSEGEERVVITFNGKFLPYVEQVAGDNVARRGQ
jgi:hypothetical protein